VLARKSAGLKKLILGADDEFKTVDQRSQGVFIPVLV
jgi:hypothetical protein